MICKNCKAFIKQNVEYGKCGILGKVERNWITHKNSKCVIDGLLKERKIVMKSE